METISKLPTKIFLCHSSNDKPAVRRLYKRLIQDGFHVWLDEENILPGQEWEMEITKAMRNSDIVIVCLTRGAITKSGYIQKEIRFALGVSEEKPDGVIFLIPAKLEECEVPEKLKRLQWVDLFTPNGYDRLLLSLKETLSKRGIISDYAEDIGTRIQSGLANLSIPSIYVPLPNRKTTNEQPQQLTIVLRPSGNNEIDKRRIKTIYGTLISFHGNDRFSFQIFEHGRGHLIDFPNDTTRVCDELLIRLKKVIGSDSDFLVEPVFIM